MTTSAPISANIIVVQGPYQTWVRSQILISSRIDSIVLPWFQGIRMIIT